MILVAFFSLSACLLALLLAARILTRADDNPPAAWALALFLVSLSAFVADQIAYHLDWFSFAPHLVGVANPFIVAIFPSLYLYVRGLTHPTSRWRPRSLFHFGPPLLAALLDLPLYLLPAADKLATARLQLSRRQVESDELVAIAVLNLYAIGYLVAAWRKLRAGRARLAESAEEGRTLAPRGLEGFVLLLIVLTVFSGVLDFTPWRFSGSLVAALAAVVAVFTAFWLLTDHQPLLIHGPNPLPSAPLAPASAVASAPSVPPVLPSPAAERPASVVSPLRPEEVERLRRRLERLFGPDKVYLNANLSLQSLAEQAETTRHKMSAAIREIHGLTFYQLVSRHRVQEAARRLQTKAGASRTIADTAFSVGFNSLSAFNAAFRAEFGLTPSQFRDKIEKVSSASNLGKAQEDKVLKKSV